MNTISSNPGYKPEQLLEKASNPKTELSVGGRPVLESR